MTSMGKRLQAIEDDNELSPPEMAQLLGMPFGTYYNFRNKTAGRLTHWQRIALTLLESTGPKKFAKLPSAK